MAGRTQVGPIGASDALMCTIDEGTMSVQDTPEPGPVGIAVDVGKMPLPERFESVLRRTLPKLPGDIQEQFAQLISPANLGILVGTLVIWAGSHYFGVGFIADLLLGAAGFIMLGMQVKQAGSDFVDAIKLTAEAETDDDLEMASLYLARFVAVVGVAVLIALVFKGAKRVAPKMRAAIVGVAARRLGGITPNHFNIFKTVAQETDRIIAVRNTNPKSTPLIERGFPAKPMEIKLHTSPKTGIVTALNPAEMQTARSKGFFVVDADLVARNAAGQELRMVGSPEWPMEPGQVIHPRMGKPLVGDYDLLGVIDPAAKGRNLVLAASEGERLPDWTNPETRRIADQLNSKMDQPRVMHGAHDGFDAVPDKGGSVVFFPDGSVKTLDTPEEVSAFYELLGRQTIKGKY